MAAQLVAQGKPGSIVNVTAVAARQAVEGVPASAYSMAKMGLDALTTHAAGELAQHGIRVNSVSRALWKPKSSSVSSLVTSWRVR